MSRDPNYLSLPLRRDRPSRRTQLCRLRQRRAALVVIIFDLAIHALKALRRDDLAGRRNRPHGTRAFAQMAGATAFGTTFEQIENMQPIKKSEHAAEGTQEAAISALGEQPNCQQRSRIEHKGPGAREF